MRKEMESNAVVWTAEPLATALRECLATLAQPHRATLATSVDAVLRAPPETVSFVDADGLAALAKKTSRPPGPIIAICDTTLQDAVGWLSTYPWLSHVMNTAMLQHGMIGEHVTNVLTAIFAEKPKLLDWLGNDVAGRRVLMTRASRRTERLERMCEFFDSQGVGTRTVELLRDVAEELLTNAFYDAPVAAGIVKKAISRTNDVLLPDNDACDLVYGCRDDLALIRVRDPFGALARARLVEVLSRCARTDMQVEVDETMGGAGLGLWRIFSNASFVAISVLGQRHTEFLVGIAKRSVRPRPFAFHLYFKQGKRRFWQLFDGVDGSEMSLEQSVAIVTKK